MIQEEELKEIESQGKKLTAKDAIRYLREKGIEVSERTLWRRLKEIREKQKRVDEVIEGFRNEETKKCLEDQE